MSRTICTESTALDAPLETIELLPHYEVRVHELAKMMGLKSKVVLSGLRAMGRTVRSASSKLEVEEIEVDALEAYLMDLAF